MKIDDNNKIIRYERELYFLCNGNFARNFWENEMKIISVITTTEIIKIKPTLYDNSQLAAHQ